MNQHGLFRPMILLIFLMIAAQTAFSGDHDDYVARNKMEEIDALVEQWKNLPSPTQEQINQLHLLYAETKKRLEVLEKVRFEGMNYNHTFYLYLRDKLQPGLSDLYSHYGLKPDETPFQKQIEQDRRQTLQVEKELREEYQKLVKTHPLIKRIMQYMGFARSETLGVGVIGKLNPDGSSSERNTECTKRIQDSALWGLDQVLDHLGSLQTIPAITLEDLSQYHGKLLGLAQHEYSTPGKVNDIFFKNGRGEKISIQEYLQVWEKEINENDPSLANAIRAYDGILHLHPYGDSNGRIAELVRQIILEKAQLPPLLTREKTAYENYLAQQYFGQGNFYKDALALARETLDYLRHWSQILNPDPNESQVEIQIQDVKLTGGHVVVAVREKGTHGNHEKIIVTNRTYRIPENVPLPPILGATVISIAPIEAAQMRITTNQWKTHRTVSPKTWVPTHREGKAELYYPFYELNIENVDENGNIHVNNKGEELPVEFVFFYKHKNGQDIWFNNKTKNFSTLIRP